ncbi:C-C motif chemokine 17 [Vombatus ursinus]|uniref:Chemokine interleukin-8-like domain-containing protein n=1 Tax=Vombatus ursinus TaxID=29139 RepID=A0A4X2LEU5_VOMUR|nr:C-C motif chemokine 17 [Vombatus ursinus]
MKGLKLSLLVVLFLGLFLHHSHSARGPNIGGQDCCNAYIKGAIPFSRLVSWSKTSADCRKEAIVFVTFLKKFVCANPKEKWVKTAIKLLPNDKQKIDSKPEISSGPQNSSLLSPTQSSPQIPSNNSAQLPSRTQLNPSQQTNSTQHLNSTSLLNSSIHLKN